MKHDVIVNEGVSHGPKCMRWGSNPPTQGISSSSRYKETAITDRWLSRCIHHSTVKQSSVSLKRFTQHPQKAETIERWTSEICKRASSCCDELRFESKWEILKVEVRWKAYLDEFCGEATIRIQVLMSENVLVRVSRILLIERCNGLSLLHFRLQ